MKMINDWTYQDKLFLTEDIPEGIIGFVYMITELSTNRKYVGKKLFYSKRKLPPLKGKKRKRIVTKETDWQSYYSSSEELQTLLEEHGQEKFKREILHLCPTKGSLSYMELIEQIERKVLLSDEYINGIIQVKIHKSHVRKIIT
jgi:hypothetical protein